MMTSWLQPLLNMNIEGNFQVTCDDDLLTTTSPKHEYRGQYSGHPVIMTSWLQPLLNMNIEGNIQVTLWWWPLDYNLS